MISVVGDSEACYWRKGVPVAIRIKCQHRMEPYSTSDFGINCIEWDANPSEVGA